MYHKNCKNCKKLQKLNNFNRLVINMNSEKIGVGGGGGCCNCYIILGGGFQKCYTVLYRVGGGQKFPIFGLYNMCTIPNHWFWIRIRGLRMIFDGLWGLDDPCTTVRMNILWKQHYPGFVRPWVKSNGYLVGHVYVILIDCRINRRNWCCRSSARSTSPRVTTQRDEVLVTIWTTCRFNYGADIHRNNYYKK